MMKLFGASKKPAAEAAKPVDPMETMAKLETQIDQIDKRIKVVENKTKAYKQEALQKKKNKDNRGAVQALKQSKMTEKELNKLDGMKIMLEQQKMMIESSSFDQNVFQSLSSGQKAVEQLTKQTDIEQFEELREKIEDQMADMSEKQEFFAGIGQEDQEELLEELDELEAELAEEEFEDLQVHGGEVKVDAQPVRQPVAPAAQKEDEEAAQLASMMMS